MQKNFKVRCIKVYENLEVRLNKEHPFERVTFTPTQTKFDAKKKKGEEGKTLKYDLYNPIIKTIRCVCYFYRYIKKNKLSKFKTRLLKWEKISLCSYLLSYWKILGLLWNKHTLWNMQTFTFI